MTLHRVPVTLPVAGQYIDAYHRHLDAPQGALFAVGVADNTDLLRGVAIVGRPAPGLQDGTTCAVLRVATDGARNACSMLYAASWDAAKGMGYTRIVTYTQNDEDGRSVASCGWTPTALNFERAGDWTNRPRRQPGRRAATRWTAQLATRWNPPLVVLPTDHTPTLWAT